MDAIIEKVKVKVPKQIADEKISEDIEFKIYPTQHTYVYKSFVFVTPIKKWRTIGEKWETVVDLTTIKKDGIDPEELLKFL
jgi:hypothetical protein